MVIDFSNVRIVHARGFAGKGSYVPFRDPKLQNCNPVTEHRWQVWYISMHELPALAGRVTELICNRCRSELDVRNFTSEMLQGNDKNWTPNHPLLPHVNSHVNWLLALGMVDSW